MSTWHNHSIPNHAACLPLPRLPLPLPLPIPPSLALTFALPLALAFTLPLPLQSMKHGGSTDVKIRRHIRVSLDELPQHQNAAASRRGVDSSAHHLMPEHGAAPTTSPAPTFPIPAIRRAPKRHGVVEQYSLNTLGLSPLATA
jgi:hypothetical protein